jgi:hypothetical protein
MLSRTGFWNVVAALFLSFFKESSAQQHLFVLTMRNLSVEFLKTTQELLEPWISKLENPTEEINAKYSQEEQKQFLKDFHDGRKELETIRAEIARDSQRITNEEFAELMKLTMEFMNKVVPKYSGGWREAMMDLMRKAVEEAKRGARFENVEIRATTACFAISVSPFILAGVLFFLSRP